MKNTSWVGLNENLIGVLSECYETGRDLKGGFYIEAPISDANFEASFNWQSPFENAGPESKAPALMALLQTGQLSSFVDAAQSVAEGLLPDSVADKTASLGSKVKEASEALKNRTGITKLNSRQIFSGMPPVKISATLHFRAIKDPKTEVVEPYLNLLKCAFPRRLAESGVFTEVLKALGDSSKSAKDVIYSMFPSYTPRFVSFKYSGNKYTPMVIESLSNPIDGPIDRNGYPLSRQVQITLATLTALDVEDDIRRIFLKK